MLHSYLRHQTQWLEIIGGLWRSGLETIQSYIERIGEWSQKAPKRTIQLMKRILAEAADPKSVDELNRIRSTLTHSQLAITEWLRMLLKDGEYLGDVDKQKLSRIDGMVIAVVFSAEEYPGDNCL